MRAIGMTHWRAIGMTHWRAIGMTHWRAIGMTHWRAIGMTHWRAMGLARIWRLGFCAVALAGAPAVAQTLQYDEDRSLPRHRSESNFADRHRPAPRHSGRLSRLALEPSHIGPAPAGFWYRCDVPAGFYPYITSCQTPWHMVPSRPPR